MAQRHPLYDRYGQDRPEHEAGGHQDNCPGRAETAVAGRSPRCVSAHGLKVRAIAEGFWGH